MWNQPHIQTFKQTYIFMNFDEAVSMKIAERYTQLQLEKERKRKSLYLSTQWSQKLENENRESVVAFCRAGSEGIHNIVIIARTWYA